MGKAYLSSKTVKVHTLICQRGRLFVPSKKDGAKKQRKSSTSYPTTDMERCQFHFKVYQDINTKQCFLRQSSGFCWSHNDHPQISRELQVDRLRNIPEESLHTAKELLNRLVPPAVVQKYLNIEDGLSLSSSSIEYLRSLVLCNKHGTCTDESAAQKLIKVLDGTKGVSYVTLTGLSNLLFYQFNFSKDSTNYHVVLFRNFRNIKSRARII